MTLGKTINKIRTESSLSQEQFATIIGVSQQSVQKWESDTSTPELEKIIKIAKYFGVSLDSLVMGNDLRVVEERDNFNHLKPEYSKIHDWEFYSSDLKTEYQQCVDEGLDIEMYKDLFFATSRLPRDEIRKKLGDVLFEVVQKAKKKEGYEFIEPSDLESIKMLRKSRKHEKTTLNKPLRSKISGAWMGRICGCFLGKTLEGIYSNELIPFLKETNNYPMHRYILSGDITEEVLNKYKYPFPPKRYYADTIDSMPPDDDTNYTVLYQLVIERYGRNFTPYDVSKAWLRYQPKDAYCTAERVAFRNFVNGYTPPQSASYQNPYREWIGAQIRADYFGYINPGNPELAAEMAWRDASVSHTKNGIYGEMLVAAMLAVAAETDNMIDVINGGLAQIPKTSRLYRDVKLVLDSYIGGVSRKDCFKLITDAYDEYTGYGWCHTNPNAMIVAASLLYGGGDYARSICMAVEACFDTDCNGATVGSILGMAKGIESIPEYWTAPINDTLCTSIFGLDKVKISDRVELTLKHIEKSSKA
ncbi:MAG: helix-turn-helix domain-containing protein [Ruminococcaceae bacterium]|nr:helix-turn-helix domain-containing protein [Oscillospiraceae bacterium]